MLLPTHKRGVVALGDGSELPYVQIGTGDVPVVVVPGAGDGLQTVDEASRQLAWFYRKRARSYRLLVLSRRVPAPDPFDVHRQASDAIHAVKQLKWPPSVWECNSAGGPVGQMVAVEAPELVRALVLSSTFHRTSARTREVLRYWLELIAEGQWGRFLWSSTELTFHRSLWLYRPLRPLLPFFVSRRHPGRVEGILRGLLNIDHRELLPRVTHRALVIGGEQDRIIPCKIMRDMAAMIPGAQLRLFSGYGHGNDQENPAYGRAFDDFVASVADEGT